MLSRLLSLLLSPLYEARSPQWSKERAAWLQDHPTCEACGTREMLVVHHEHPYQYFPELELSWSNFMTLCEHPSRNCHLNIGHSGDFRAWNPNARTDAALMLKRRNERKYSR